MAFRRGLEFTWKPIERVAEDSVSNLNTAEGIAPGPPPVSNNFLLLSGGNFKLLNGENFLLLE